MLTWGRGWGNRGEILLDGVPVGRFEQGVWRERATVVLPDGPWQLAVRLDTVTVTGPRGEQLTAQRRGWLASRWGVTTKGAWYEVSKGFFGTSMTVSTSGVVIGRVRREGFGPWSRMRLDVPSGVPLAHQVVLLWLGRVQERRRTRDAIDLLAPV